MTIKEYLENKDEYIDIEIYDDGKLIYEGIADGLPYEMSIYSILEEDIEETEELITINIDTFE